MKPSILTGSRFNKLVVKAPASRRNTDGSTVWSCECDCGQETQVLGYNLLNDNTKSCGCLVKKHGWHGTSEYSTWSGMKNRCQREANINFKDYGGRGIEVCSRWRESFQNFITDMGAKPSDGHTLERRDVNGPYEPNNCYWATSEEQANNRRDNVFYEIDGNKLTQAQLARSVGLTPSTLNIRLNKGGMSVEEAIATPLQKVRNEKFAHNGKSQTLQEWAAETGLSYRCLRDRIKTLHWSLDKALQTKVGDTPKSHPMRLKS